MASGWLSAQSTASPGRSMISESRYRQAHCPEYPCTSWANRDTETLLSPERVLYNPKVGSDLWKATSLLFPRMNADTLLHRYGNIYLTRLRNTLKLVKGQAGTLRLSNEAKTRGTTGHHATYIRKGACHCLITPWTVILHLLLCASDIRLSREEVFPEANTQIRYKKLSFPPFRSTAPLWLVISWYWPSGSENERPHNG